MVYNLKALGLKWKNLSLSHQQQQEQEVPLETERASEGLPPPAPGPEPKTPSRPQEPEAVAAAAAEESSEADSPERQELPGLKFRWDGARQLKKPTGVCVLCELQKDEEELAAAGAAAGRSSSKSFARPMLTRLLSSSAVLSKCFLCGRTLCSKHCEAFALPYGVLPPAWQDDKTYVCQDCLPEAKSLRDQELAKDHERRLERAEARREEAVRNGGGACQPEQSRQCIDCSGKADCHCPICGIALCGKHVVYYPSSAGSRASKKVKACSRCEAVAQAQASARQVVRAAVATSWRGALDAQQLQFCVAVSKGLVPQGEEAEDCAVCGMAFSKLPGFLRHHCRGCGLSLCSSCLCGKAGCLGQGPLCPHRAQISVFGVTKEERVCHRCLPKTKVRAQANAACEKICSTALKHATHYWRTREFISDPAAFPHYEQRYVDTAKHKALRAGTFAVEGARQAAPFLSMPWAVGVRAADLVWNYGQYGLVGILCSGEIMEGVKTLMQLSSTLQSIQPRDLLVGMVYLSADQRRQLRDDPAGLQSGAQTLGKPLPPGMLEALIGLAVLGMHGPYETDPFEAQRFALQQSWRLVTERLGESWKHQPSWCLYVRAEDRLAAIGIRGTDLEQSCGGDLFTDVNAVPVRTEGVDGKVVVAHSGVLASARALERELRPTFRALVAAGYQVVISGHSLGAAVAGLLVWLLHWGADGERLPPGASVFGVGYASPCAVDKEASVDLQPHFTSVVDSMDVVPRLSTGTLKRLGTDIVACARQSASDLDEDVSHFVDRLSTLWAPRMREGVLLPASATAPVVPSEGGVATSRTEELPGSGYSMGFEVMLNTDPFPGADHHTMSASDLDACKRTCKEMGCGAFVIWRGTAYFRAQSAQECRKHMVTSTGSITYLNLATEDSLAEPVPEVTDLYVPGLVVWIHRVHGHLQAAVVPCDLPPLRRITLDKRMFTDHSRLSYHGALNAVRTHSALSGSAREVRWQRFSDAGERCPCCGSIYEWMNTARSAKQRWHAMTNCRSCGLVVCLGCATTRKALPEQGIMEQARVCDRCVWRAPGDGASLAGLPQSFQLLAGSQEQR